MKKPILWKSFLGFVLSMATVLVFLRLMRGKPWPWQAYAFFVGFVAIIIGIGFIGHLLVRSRPKALRAVYWAGMIASVLLVVMWGVDVVFWGKVITLRNAFMPIVFAFSAYNFYRLLKVKNKIKK